MIRAHAISELDGQRRGIHVLFCGPPAWLYAPRGWFIERRLTQRREGKTHCAILEGAKLAELRRERELATTIGVATLRDGKPAPQFSATGAATEVLTIDLSATATNVRVVIEGVNWTAYALFGGKVVAAMPPRAQAGQQLLSASAIDRVVVHAELASKWQVCAAVDAISASGWNNIAELQLPVHEVDPSLPDPDAEFARAKERLIPGDDLGEVEFRELADALRGLGTTPPSRPFDQVVRPDPDSPETMLGALDPLRMALLDPTLRRALGMAFFDDDPALIEGESYEYRVRATFPVDAHEPRAGFGAIPVGTSVPADFFCGDVHVRLARPSRVEFVETHVIGDWAIGRRGIALQHDGARPWMLPDLEDARIVLEFAVPRTALVFEGTDADLQLQAFDADGNPISTSSQAGTAELNLTFGGPCSRLFVRGKGHWLGLRNGTPGEAEFAAVTPSVLFGPSAGPPPPLWVRATSTNAIPSADLRPRSELGFDVRWQPPLAFGVNAWPPDAAAAPPLEATRFELEHAPAGSSLFHGVFGDGGAAYGQRGTSPPPAFGPGSDAMVVFAENPVQPNGAVVEFSIRDQFDRDPAMAAPAPGTLHTYRIRSIDEIGRPSDWTISPATLLEKHSPPPVPPGPPAQTFDDETKGVQARTLVRGAPDLTDADVALLDAAVAQTTIILRWGWTDEQRAIDPWATEFRIYVGEGGIGAVRGRVTSVADLGTGRFAVTLELNRKVAADAARGGFLPAGGEYRILAHTGGSSISATVETRLPLADGTFPVPRIGTTVLPVQWKPDQSRSDAWDERVSSVPITNAQAYEFVLHDRAVPSATNPRQVIWVGVSAADAQAYVADARPGGGRPGNESPIVGVRCETRYHGRPDLVVAPPIGDVPVVTTARSTTAGIEHEIDLLPFLAGSPLVSGELVVVERIDNGTLLSALRSDGAVVVAAAPDTGPRDAPELPIDIPNADDHTAITAALGSSPDSIADRYLVWLAARHPYADWLFTPEPEPMLLGAPVRLRLPAGGGRYVLRVRRVDAAGHRSAGSATCPVVIRVPVLAQLAPPLYGGARWTTTSGVPRLEFTATISDTRATHLLTWIGAVDPRGAALATIGSRRDLPGFGVRLRLGDGPALAPEVLALDPADDVAPNVPRSVTDARDVADGPHFLWLALVDGDGVPSALAGAYRLPARGP